MFICKHCNKILQLNSYMVNVFDVSQGVILCYNEHI